jgi:hypothetical protein
MDGASVELDGSQARLSSVTGLAVVAQNPVADGASMVSAIRQGLDNLLQGGGRIFCLHPFIHPQGDRRGDYAYMTPQQAVSGLADKLADTVDILPAGALDCVAVLIRGVDFAGFAAALGAFNMVFPATELLLAQRRADDLAALEQTKLARPDGGIAPRWLQQDARRHPAIRQLDTAMGNLVAAGEGYDQENTGPEAELAALIDKKRAYLTSIEDAWTEASAALQGGAGLLLDMAGSRDTLHGQMRGAVPEVEGYKLAAVACWVGSPEQMTIFREVFGV